MTEQIRLLFLNTNGTEKYKQEISKITKNYDIACLAEQHLPANQTQIDKRIKELEKLNNKKIYYTVAKDGKKKKQQQ